MDTNYYISQDIEKALYKSVEIEEDTLSKDVFKMLIQNANIAKEDKIPICQDTGMVVVFLEVGQDVHFVGGNIEKAINEGVKDGYEKGYLRKSVVKDPVIRENTKDNTPAIVHYKIVEGSNVKLTVAPKGFGSENMSKIYMLKPSDGIEGVKEAVINTVKVAGSNPCPPIIVGVGVGGDFEKSALMAKEGLLREVGSINENNYWANVENELLEKINNLNIGIGGFGGKTTSLGVHIKTYPTHIAGLPVAVNIGCHVTRHKSIII